MNQLEKEAQFFSLFHKRGESIYWIPEKLKNYLNESGSDEKIIGLEKADYQSILNGGTFPKSLAPICMDRKIMEYFSCMTLQVIAAVCIHSSSQVLLLQLTKDTKIDGYTKGALTYPQGHCTWDSIKDRLYTGVISWQGFRDVIVKNAYRETSEELQIDDFYLNLEFFMELDSIMQKCAANREIYPIYIDKPGSTSRHLCFLIDIEFSDEKFMKYAPHIRSKEPDKHNVLILNYKGIVESVGRIDMICPWVASSFSRLPFFTKSFMTSYIRENP